MTTVSPRAWSKPARERRRLAEVAPQADDPDVRRRRVQPRQRCECPVGRPVVDEHGLPLDAERLERRLELVVQKRDAALLVVNRDDDRQHAAERIRHGCCGTVSVVATVSVVVGAVVVVVGGCVVVVGGVVVVGRVVVVGVVVLAVSSVVGGAVVVDGVVVLVVLGACVVSAGVVVPAPVSSSLRSTAAAIPAATSKAAAIAPSAIHSRLRLRAGGCRGAGAITIVGAAVLGRHGKDAGLRRAVERGHQRGAVGRPLPGSFAIAATASAASRGRRVGPE